jgi:hypothetical protein
MRGTMNPKESVVGLFVLTVAMLMLAAGCSTDDAPGTSVITEFVIDFAREVVAAWLL